MTLRCSSSFLPMVHTTTNKMETSIKFCIVFAVTFPLIHNNFVESIKIFHDIESDYTNTTNLPQQELINATKSAALSEDQNAVDVVVTEKIPTSTKGDTPGEPETPSKVVESLENSSVKIVLPENDSKIGNSDSLKHSPSTTGSPVESTSSEIFTTTTTTVNLSETPITIKLPTNFKDTSEMTVMVNPTDATMPIEQNTVKAFKQPVQSVPQESNGDISKKVPLDNWPLKVPFKPSFHQFLMELLNARHILIHELLKPYDYSYGPILLKPNDKLAGNPRNDNPNSSVESPKLPENVSKTINKTEVVHLTDSTENDLKNESIIPNNHSKGLSETVFKNTIKHETIQHEKTHENSDVKIIKYQHVRQELEKEAQAILKAVLEQRPEVPKNPSIVHIFKNPDKATKNFQMKDVKKGSIGDYESRWFWNLFGRGQLTTEISNPDTTATNSSPEVTPPTSPAPNIPYKEKTILKPEVIDSGSLGPGKSYYGCPYEFTEESSAHTKRNSGLKTWLSWFSFN